MQHRRRALLAATLLVAACGGATVAATETNRTSANEGTDAGDDATLDAPPDSARDAATDIPLLDEHACREAGTLFECLDCCDDLYAPGQQIYLEAMDRCACESCPECAGSSICVLDAGAPSGSSKCYDCADQTREHDGPQSCHPYAQEQCDQVAGCIASQRCMLRSRCFNKPAQ